MFLELLILITTIALLRAFVFKSRTERMLEVFPAPKSYPLIGNLLEFDFSKEDVVDTLRRLSVDYGPVYLMRMGFRNPVVCIRSPEDCEVTIGNTALIEKSSEYDPLIPWLNQGLLTSKGEKWRKHRKIITPSFHFTILEKLVPIFVENSQKFIKNIETVVGQVIDVTPWVSFCSLDIICESAMGIKVNAQEKESQYVKAVIELQEIVSRRSFDFILKSSLFPLLPIGRKHNKLVDYLHSVTNNVIKERKEQKQRNVLNEEEDGSGYDTKKKKAFLDLLLEYNHNGAGMTDSEIREEVDTFMFEGFDTTTATTSFCLYSLSQHPEIQDKAHEEQVRIFGESARHASYQDLLEMKYLGNVIKETLRRYPTVPFVGRLINKDLLLKSGHIVPSNTSVLVLIDAMNHDPQLHKDPFTFNPDRFEEKLQHPYAFIPFAAGPRNCIGQKYAMLEVKCMLSSILRNFRLLPSDIPVTPCFKVVLKSTTGIHVRFELRT